MLTAEVEKSIGTSCLSANACACAETHGRSRYNYQYETARQRALDLAQQAEAELDVLPPSPARDALQGSIAYAVERRS